MSDFVHNQGYIYPISNEEYEKLDEKYFDLEEKGYDLEVFDGQKGLNRYLVFLTYHSYGEKHDNFGSSRPCTEFEIKRHIKKFQDVLCKEIDKNKLKYIEYCWYNCSECFDYYEEEEYKPMTLTEAIQHCKDVANIQSHTCISEQRKCSAEHQQLAMWLQKLADYEDETYISEDWLTKNGFELKKVQNGIDKEPQPEYIYCNDAIEIAAELRDEERGIWRVWINFFDECCPTDLDICTVGQLRMFLAICGLDNLVNEFKA